MGFTAFLPGPDASLGGLFVASFLSATLLPGGSEAVLLGVLTLHPNSTTTALLLATLGNTLGGMTTYAMARALPQKVGAGETAGKAGQYIAQLRRWGSPALLLAWAPVIGDALCAAAGWLRLRWLPCALWMGLGKAARYGFVAWAAS